MTNDELLKEVVIILGAPRSGTTILSNLLGQHRDVELAIEPRMTWRYGNDRRSDMLDPKHATPEIIAHIRNTFADLMRKNNKTRLIEKTPSNSIRPEFVRDY